MSFSLFKKSPQNSSAIAEKLEELKRKEEEDRAKELAKKLNLPYLNLIITPVEIEALGLINEDQARKGCLAIIQKTNRKLHLAVLNPQAEETQAITQKLLQQNFQLAFFVVSLHSLKKAWQHYQELTPPSKEIIGRLDLSAELLAALRAELKNLTDIKQKIQSLPPADTAKILEVMVAGALQTEASDIHIETKESNALIRYRLDGVLQNVASLEPKSYQAILSRIKLLSEMKLNIHDIAQDGRFTVRLDATDIENRVSIIPGAYGENIVIRVLNPQALKPGLKDLGLRPDLYAIIEKEIKKPTGMMITTGPTGSGKTTALYAFLKARVSPEIKIITLEDPIEYHLSGIVQTQIESEHGYTFASGLRAILRQDPDIILVGEIRDKETAEIAVHAALTGHLVFSTLHTNDAAGAVPRFIDLGVKAPILAGALNLVMAQRLVRKICVACQEEFLPDQETMEKIKINLAKTPATLQPVDLTQPFKLKRGRGCPACNQTGYKGRTGIFELFTIDANLEKLIAQNISHIEILEDITKRGMLTLYQDGLLKVIAGITTLEEVESVTGAE